MDRIDVAQCRPKACLLMEQGGVRRALMIITVAVVTLVATVALFAAPVSAQTPTDAPRIIQGGPFGGISADGRGVFPEVGFRLGTQRGTQVLDLSLSLYRSQYLLVPVVRIWSFEALAGLNWQPGPFGLGFRSGIVRSPTILGEVHTSGVFGPHAALVIPTGARFGIRSEAGAHLYFSNQMGLGVPRGYIRMGLEVRR
jgi:hypothetical protein